MLGGPNCSARYRSANDSRLDEALRIWESADASQPIAYEQALTRYADLRETDSHQAFGWLALTCGRIAGCRDESTSAIAFLSEALGRFTFVGDTYGSAIAEAHLAIPELSRRNFDRALQLSLRPWAAGVKFTNFDADLLHVISGTAYWSLGDMESALLHLTKAYKLQSENPPRHRLASICNNIGVCFMFMGQWDVALTMISRAVEIGRKLEGNTALRNQRFNLLACFINLEKFDEAHSYANECYEFLLEGGSIGASDVHNLAEALALLGDIPRATWCLDQLRTMNETKPSEFMQRLVDLTEAQIVEARCEFDNAKRRCKKLLEQQDMPDILKKTIYRTLARIGERERKSADSAKWKRLGDEIGRERTLERVLSKDLRLNSTARKPAIPLTHQELTCLALSAKGQSSTDIAYKLGIKPRTVNFHFSKVLKKLDAMNRQEAIAKAVGANLI